MKKVADIYILATTLCRRCYTTISNDIFVVANSDVSAMTIVTISDENVIADGIIIATTKCRC